MCDAGCDKRVALVPSPDRVVSELSPLSFTSIPRVVSTGSLASSTLVAMRPLTSLFTFTSTDAASRYGLVSFPLRSLSPFFASNVHTLSVLETWSSPSILRYTIEFTLAPLLSLLFTSLCMHVPLRHSCLVVFASRVCVRNGKQFPATHTRTYYPSIDGTNGTRSSAMIVCSCDHLNAKSQYSGGPATCELRDDTVQGLHKHS